MIKEQHPKGDKDIFEVTVAQFFHTVQLQKPTDLYMPVFIDKARVYFRSTFDQVETFLHWHPQVRKITYRYTDSGTLYIQKFESK